MSGITYQEMFQKGQEVQEALRRRLAVTLLELDTTIVALGIREVRGGWGTWKAVDKDGREVSRLTSAGFQQMMLDREVRQMSPSMNMIYCQTLDFLKDQVPTLESLHGWMLSAKTYSGLKLIQPEPDPSLDWQMRLQGRALLKWQVGMLYRQILALGGMTPELILNRFGDQGNQIAYLWGAP